MITKYSIKGIFKEINVERSLWIYLPPNYGSTNKKYPVIYLQDGKRLIDPEACNNLFIFESWFEQDPKTEFIIIAIEAINRNNEYTPWKSIKDAQVYGEFGGEGDAYLQFLTQIIKPRIDLSYRTLTENKHTTIAGCSLGGLIAIYGGLCYPDIFGNIVGLSSSVWFEGFYAFAERAIIAPESKLYMDVSKSEGKNMWNSNQKFYSLLVQKGLSDSHFYMAKSGKHTTEHFIKRLPLAFEWLFRKINN